MSNDEIKKEPSQFDRMKRKHFKNNTQMREANSKVTKAVRYDSEHVKQSVDDFLADKKNKIITKRPPTS